MALFAVAAMEAGILAGILWVLARIPVVLEALREDYRSPALVKLEERIRELERHRSDLEAEVERLRTYVREEREATERAAERARFHARRARQEREQEASGPDAESPQDDGGGGEGGGMQAMRARVAAESATPSPEEVRAAARRAVALR